MLDAISDTVILSFQDQIDPDNIGERILTNSIIRRHFKACPTAGSAELDNAAATSVFFSVAEVLCGGNLPSTPIQQALNDSPIAGYVRAQGRLLKAYGKFLDFDFR